MRIEPADIGRVVRHHRRRARLSQAQLAELAGVGKTLVFDLEHGKESVQLDSLHKVLSALNIQLCLESPLMPELEEEPD
jgi:HTH-type transcriptional regulator/antitoxin HipB